MAVEKLPDLDQAALELLRLERRGKDLERRLERLSERNAAFPSAFARTQLEEVVREQLDVLRRIDELQLLLRPIRRVP
jgi:hypothetical protein